MNEAVKEPKIIVYRARNLVNGHAYIGFTTKGLAHREKRHRESANSQHGGFRFHRAIRKYGHENFVFEVLMDFLDDEELAKVYEWEVISKYKPEYNISAGGDGGSVHPDTARKISAANKGQTPVFKGRKFSAEALAKFRASRIAAPKPHPRLGAVVSAETRRKMSEANKGKTSPNKGKTFSEEIRQRMTVAARARPPRVVTEELRASLRLSAKKAHAAIRKPVRCINDGRVFGSAVEAGTFYGFAHNAVSKRITRPRKTKDGLQFEYVLGDK